MRSDEVKVSVLCPTYNHAPYIRACLEGVLKQETDFKYEILVHDDYSTDGTADVVQEYADRYPERIRFIRQTENQYSRGVDIVRDVLLPQSRGEYIAICEGDDYWTHPKKLQMQVPMLDADATVGMVYTYFDKFNESRQEMVSFRFHELEGNVYARSLACRDSIWYVTVLMRKSLMLQAPKLDSRRYFTGDIFWFNWIASRSQVKLLRERTAVHRILEVSMSHFKEKRRKIDFFFLSSNTRLYFATHYPPAEGKRSVRLVRKKSAVNCFKYALAHADYSLCRELYIPLFPMMSLKKTLYALIHRCCRSERSFMRMCERYDRHLSQAEK